MLNYVPYVSVPDKCVNSSMDCIATQLNLCIAASDVLLLDWNVRGLNAPVKRAVVHDMVTATRATVAYIQETKLQLFDGHLVSETLG
jgi:hypothetical protein